MAEEDDRAGRAYEWAVIGIIAGVIRAIGSIIAVILVAYVVLTIFGANPDNTITQFVKSLADPLALWFRDLFLPDDQRLRVLANYGLAAIFWLIATSIIARLVRSLAGRA